MKEPVYWRTAYARFSRLSLHLSLPLSPVLLPTTFVPVSLSLCPFVPVCVAPRRSSIVIVRSLTSFRLSPFRSRSQASVYALGRHRRRKREKEGGRGRKRERERERRSEWEGERGRRRQARERVVSGHRKRAVPCVCWPVRERTPRCTDLSSSLCRVTACVSLSLFPVSLSLFLSLSASLPSLFFPFFLSPPLPPRVPLRLAVPFLYLDSLATLVAGLSDSRRERRRSFARPREKSFVRARTFSDFGSNVASALPDRTRPGRYVCACVL